MVDASSLAAAEMTGRSSGYWMRSKLSTPRLSTFLLDDLEARDAGYRLGVVYTSDNRNREFDQRASLSAIRAARCVAVEMELATIAANGFRYRIPNATLPCVPDKPLHASPKPSAASVACYEASEREHLGIALSCLDRVRREHPDGLPAQEVRAPDEPLLGAERAASPRCIDRSVRLRPANHTVGIRWDPSGCEQRAARRGEDRARPGASRSRQ
jgi:hypothetical protein